MSEHTAPTLIIDDFEGPLDVLLHLIRKHKMDIQDIPIASIVEQYLAFLEQAKQLDMEIATEFVEMAARLVHMKSVMLLPKHEEGEELKEELQGQLIQYQLLKDVVEILKDQTDGFLKFIKPEMEMELDLTYRNIHHKKDLFDALRAVQGKAQRRMPPEEKVFDRYVAQKNVSVSSRIMFILRAFRKNKRIETGQLFQNEDKSTAVATFLAILEMVKKKRIYFDKEDKYLYYKKEQKG